MVRGLPTRTSHVFSWCTLFYGLLLVTIYCLVSKGHLLVEYVPYASAHHGNGTSNIVKLINKPSASVTTTNKTTSSVVTNNNGTSVSNTTTHIISNITTSATVTHPPPPPTVSPRPVPNDCLFAKMPLAGRLGNELFMYAAVFALGVRYNRTVVFHSNSALYRIFNITALPITPPSGGWKSRKEKYASSYDGDLARFVEGNHGHLQLVGYFQSYKYFEKIDTNLHKELTFRSEIQRDVEEFLKRSLEESFKQTGNVSSVVFIGVHIRRGDMATHYSHRRGYTVASKEYLDHAVEYFQEIVDRKRILFVIVSDDMQWSKKYFNPRGSHVVYSSFKVSPSLDLGLLAACNHTIMTVGSYGWWGAYLAGGNTTYYKDFPVPGTYISRLFNKKDYFYTGWVGLR